MKMAKEEGEDGGMPPTDEEDTGGSMNEGAPPLPDDIMYRILKVSPLNSPLRYFACENKMYRQMCSQTSFLNHFEAIFSVSYDSDGNTIVRNWSGTSPRIRVLEGVTLKILGSCNGLLLVRFPDETRHVIDPTTTDLLSTTGSRDYVFNPITSCIAPLTNIIGYVEPYNIGFTVPETTNSIFKLVGIYLWLGFTLDLRVLDASASITDSGLQYRNTLPFKSLEINKPPVYAGGSVYWMGEGGRSMFGWDMEKEEFWETYGPIESGIPIPMSMWFGNCKGVLKCVYYKDFETVVSRYEGGRDGDWEVEDRFYVLQVESDKPLFYDDGHMILYVMRVDGDVYTYDLENSSSARIWSAGADSVPNFILYNSSFAPVSNPGVGAGEYAELAEHEKKAMIQLSKLLRPA